MTTAVETLRDTPFIVAGRTFQSRLMVGTGKYRDNETMVRAIEASGAEIVTVAVRRVDLDRTKEAGILHHLDPRKYFLLANTAGCYTAQDAIRYARLAREAGFNEFVKLEVIGDQETLLPDVQGLLDAARTLVREGFKVLAYTNEDLVTALRLEEVGCAAVMPLASPIGSGLGLLNPYGVRTIKRRLKVPVVVDAGVGTASDACLTMEQGVDGILMNTAIAAAQDPVAMAQAMRLAVEAGRLAFLAGRMPKREVAVPSSPLEGLLDQGRDRRAPRGSGDPPGGPGRSHPQRRPRSPPRRPRRARPATRVRAVGRRAAASDRARRRTAPRARRPPPARRAAPRRLPAARAQSRSGARGGLDQRGAGAGDDGGGRGAVRQSVSSTPVTGCGMGDGGCVPLPPRLAGATLAGKLRCRGSSTTARVERHEVAACASTCSLGHRNAGNSAPRSGTRDPAGTVRRRARRYPSSIPHPPSREAPRVYRGRVSRPGPRPRAGVSVRGDPRGRPGVRRLRGARRQRRDAGAAGGTGGRRRRSAGPARSPRRHHPPRRSGDPRAGCRSSGCPVRGGRVGRRAGGRSLHRHRHDGAAPRRALARDRARHRPCGRAAAGLARGGGPVGAPGRTARLCDLLARTGGEHGRRECVPDRPRGVHARDRSGRGPGAAHPRGRLPVPAAASWHGRRVRRPAGAEALMQFRRRFPPLREWRLPTFGLERRSATRWAMLVLGLVLLGYLTAFFFVFPTPILHARQTVPRVLGLTLQDASREIRDAGLQVVDGGTEPHPTAPQGTIIWQDPPPRLSAVPDGRVTTVPSAGPPQLPAPDA